MRDVPLRAFKWRDDAYNAKDVPDRHVIGWTADDVLPVFPKAVKTTRKSGAAARKTLDVSQIVACMYGALQKLQGMMDHSLQRLDALGDKLDREVALVADGIDAKVAGAGAADTTATALRAEVANLSTTVAQLKTARSAVNLSSDAMDDHQLQLDAIKSEIIQLRRSFGVLRSQALLSG